MSGLPRKKCTPKSTQPSLFHIDFFPCHDICCTLSVHFIRYPHYTLSCSMSFALSSFSVHAWKELSSSSNFCDQFWYRSSRLFRIVLLSQSFRRSTARVIVVSLRLAICFLVPIKEWMARCVPAIVFFCSTFPVQYPMIVLSRTNMSWHSCIKYVTCEWKSEGANPRKFRAWCGVTCGVKTALEVDKRTAQRGRFRKKMIVTEEREGLTWWKEKGSSSRVTKFMFEQPEALLRKRWMRTVSKSMFFALRFA